MFSRKLLVLVTIFIAIFKPAIHTGAWPVDSYEELRYENVRKQNTFSSCGPASLATLFSEFYGKEISEEEIAEKTKPYLDEEIEKLEEGEVPEGGVSMLDLKKVSEDLGIAARGYEIPKEKLLEITKSLSTPLLIYLENPEEHFVLSLGGGSGMVVLADPTWGTRVIGKESLFDKWKGLILAFSPRPDYRERSEQVIEQVLQEARQRNLMIGFTRKFL